MATAHALWVENPPSAPIAEALNQTHAAVCEHDRDPCYLRCGVQRRYGSTGRWEVIPQAERRRWAESVLGGEN